VERRREAARAGVRRNPMSPAPRRPQGRREPLAMRPASSPETEGERDVGRARIERTNRAAVKDASLVASAVRRRQRGDAAHDHYSPHRPGPRLRS
jgi:hypothetical protein